MGDLEEEGGIEKKAVVSLSSLHGFGTTSGLTEEEITVWKEPLRGLLLLAQGARKAPQHSFSSSSSSSSSSGGASLIPLVLVHLSYLCLFLE